MRQFIVLLSFMIFTFNSECAKNSQKIARYNSQKTKKNNKNSAEKKKRVMLSEYLRDLDSTTEKNDTAENTEEKKKTLSIAKQLTTTRQAVLLDLDTNNCLFDVSAEERCIPSSMTKLMTLYLLFEALKKNDVHLNDEFIVSSNAQKMRGSRSFFQAGKLAKIEDLIRSIIVHSGNDASVIVAEGLAGDVDAFVIEMNEKAKDFGLKNTNFLNPTGYPADGHYSCVLDLAIIAKRLILDFPQYYHYFSEKVFTVNGIIQANRNSLLGNQINVDGLKTGMTDLGGYGLVTSAKNNGKRLIVVVNGCLNSKDRLNDANKLLAIGFKEFVLCKIADAGEEIISAKVWLGKTDIVKLCAHENIAVSLPRKYKKMLTAEIVFNEPIEAPVNLGDKLGTLSYKYGDFISKKYDLFACEHVGKAGFIQRIKLSIMHLVFGINEKNQAPEKLSVMDKILINKNKNA